MKSKLILLTILLVSASTNMQGQNVIYKYNAQGSCTSRVYAASAKKAKSSKKLSAESSPIKVSVSPCTTFRDNVTISTVGTSNSLAYVLTNASGQIFLKGTVSNKGVTLATSNLPCGIYLLRVSGENYEHSYKLLKK